MIESTQRQAPHTVQLHSTLHMCSEPGNHVPGKDMCKLTLLLICYKEAKSQLHTLLSRLVKWRFVTITLYHLEYALLLRALTAAITCIIRHMRIKQTKQKKKKQNKKALSLVLRHYMSIKIRNTV